MSQIELGDPAVGEEVAAVATRMSEYLADVANDVYDVIADVLPRLGADERDHALLGASIQENVNTVLHILQHRIESAVAPNAAIEFARRLAQRDIGVSALLRTYRVGQTRFQRDFITELLRGRASDHVEGNTALSMVEIVSGYVDSVVEQLLETYEQAREEWVSHHSAVFVQHLRTLLREREVSLDDAQGMLGGYRLSQHHLGAVIWCDETQPDARALAVLNQCSLKLAEAAECVELPLFVPYDESSAWLWLPLAARHEVPREPLESVAVVAKERVSVALGEPMPSLSGFRRTHRQAVLARAVAVAAKPSLSRLTVFADVAPISSMCSDLEAARAWIAETLGSLAIDDERGSLLRETARVFLANGGSFTATANQMILHRNTAQYRIRKAEELRGRPLREGHLDVELALLACHYLGNAVLQPVPTEGEGQPRSATLA
ncbi:MAG: hypothetical protein JWO85_1639 [Candidatus Eremiobacteraeota bacterium]|nr:hypothetical protein [Candidatus Eremiobacteraeota bacterium]